MSAYYNEFEPYAAEWLKNLIDAGHIAPGDVDNRSITEVKPDDLKGYEQCHFFAGIGGWSLAARLAGWSDERPLWTGSCPCQPFSAAGKQKGKEDDRHLWPVWYDLIRQCRPSNVAGEQVASAIGHGWLDGVYSDLEASDYAVGSVVLPACAVNAPHRRDRLWFVAHTDSDGQRAGHGCHGEREISEPCRSSGICDVADSEIFGREQGMQDICGNSKGDCQRQGAGPALYGSESRVMGNSNGEQRGWIGDSSDSGTLANTSGRRLGGSDQRESKQSGRTETISASPLGNAIDTGLEGHPGHVIDRTGRQEENGPDGRKRTDQLPRPVAAIGGANVNGSSGTMEKRGALNPEFVFWLMGFPAEWLWSAPENKASPRFIGIKE